MRFLASVILLQLLVSQSIGGSGARNLQAKSDSPTVKYWRQKLPMTPIPNILLKQLSPVSVSPTILSAVNDTGLVNQAKTYFKMPSDTGLVNQAKTYFEMPSDTGLVNQAKTYFKMPSHTGLVNQAKTYFKEPSDTGLVNQAKTYFKEPSDQEHIDGSANEQMLADPSLSLFLLEKDFKIGSKKTLDLGWKTSPDVYFLPRTKTNEIPFSSNKLSLALEYLKIPRGSEMAIAMKKTLEACERPAMNGESKFCADSLESMIDYATSKLGTNHVNVLALNVQQSLKSVKQQYSVAAIPFQSQYGSKSVSCHRLTYPYAVYYCHEMEATRAMQVSLKGEDGSSAGGVVVCHADTSAWNPEQAVLKVLNVKPGGPAVCHFNMEDDIVWVPSN